MLRAEPGDQRIKKVEFLSTRVASLRLRSLNGILVTEYLLEFKPSSSKTRASKTPEGEPVMPAW